MSVVMAATAAALFAIGTYLLLQRKLSRIIVGLGLISHGANVLFVNAGRRGLPPLIGQGDPADFADPMPQALVLTAIVISFGTTALLLALAYRSWLLTSDDEVADDIEDRIVGGPRLRATSRSPTRRCSSTRPSSATTFRSGSSVVRATIRSEARDEGAAAAAGRAAVDRRRALDPGRPLADGAACRSASAS